MITIFQEVSPRLLDAIRSDPALIVAVLEMEWDTLDTPLGAITVRTRTKKRVERMNEDERAVFYKLNVGPINQRIAHPPRSRMLSKDREKEAAARRALDQMKFTEEDLAAELAVDRAYLIEYLLCGGLGGTTALSRAISGGAQIGHDLGCGPANFLTAGEVLEAAAALSQVSDDDLSGRLDSGSIDWEVVSPGDLPGVLRGFAAIRTYYEGAAARGNASLSFDEW